MKRTLTVIDNIMWFDVFFSSDFCLLPEMLSESSLESLPKASNVEEFLEILEIKPHYPIVDLILNEFVLFGVRELDVSCYCLDFLIEKNFF